MTSRKHLDPPRGASWLISLFINHDEAGAVLGDLSEEFSLVAATSGIGTARRWYWRQSVKSLPHLFLSAFRLSPWSIFTAIAAGFLLRQLMAPLPAFATFAYIERFNFFEHHVTLYQFLASTALDIEHALTFLFVGCIVALLARGRELAPAVALAVIYCAMALVASALFAIRSSEAVLLSRLSWAMADSFAVVLGAAIVKTLRPNEPEMLPQ